jgi:hypothetical protein
VYSDLHERLKNDGLPPGVGEAVGAAINGLWLYFVLGLVPVNQELVVTVRAALENALADAPNASLNPDASMTETARAPARSARARLAGGRRR